MPTAKALLEDFRRQRADLQQQLKMLESGELRTGERRRSDPTFRDTTPASIAMANAHIAIFDRAIAELEGRAS